MNGVWAAGRRAGALKLIKTIALEFREGKSDKVYEVNLCEVGPDRFVVNFRYGRRGAKLQSGSKTAVPVARDKAERIYDSLVDEKVGKGYHEPGATPAAAPQAPSSAATGSAPVDVAARREAAILARLRYAERVELGPSGFSTAWKLSRVVWRAGELRIPRPSRCCGSSCAARRSGRKSSLLPRRRARCRPGRPGRSRPIKMLSRPGTIAAAVTGTDPGRPTTRRHCSSTARLGAGALRHGREHSQASSVRGRSHEARAGPPDRARIHPPAHDR